MHTLVRSLGLHRPNVTPCGVPVSVGEAHALREIASEVGITQNGLAERLQLDKSTTSRLVSMLEQRGWVERMKSISDRRFYNLRLTAKGSKSNADIGKARRAKFQRVIDAVAPEHRESVTTAVSLLVEALSES